MFLYLVSVVVTVVFRVGVGPFVTVAATVLVTTFTVGDGKMQLQAVETADFATPLIDGSGAARLSMSRAAFWYPTVDVS